MRRRRQTPQKSRSKIKTPLGSGFRIPGSGGTYQDAKPKQDVAGDPVWYEAQPGETLVMITVDLDIAPYKSNEFPRVMEHGSWNVNPPQFTKGTVAMWMGLERVNESFSGPGNSRRVLKPIYLLGSDRVIIDPKYLEPLPEE